MAASSDPQITLPSVDLCTKTSEGRPGMGNGFSSFPGNGISGLGLMEDHTESGVRRASPVKTTQRSIERWRAECLRNSGEAQFSGLRIVDWVTAVSWLQRMS